jgi:hypothetical protein
MSHNNPHSTSIDASIGNYYYRRTIDLSSIPYVIALLPAFHHSLPNKLHKGKSGASTSRGSAMRCTWRVSWSAIRSTRLQVHHSHQAYLVVGSKGSCHVPTPATLHCCLHRVAHQLYPVFSLAKTRSLLSSHAAPPGLSIEKGQGRPRTHVLFFACAVCLLVFHSCPRLSCLPAFLRTLTHLLISCHLHCFSPSTIEQTLRLPSHDHRVDCPRLAMPQLPPSTRPQHQTPKPCVR